VRPTYLHWIKDRLESLQAGADYPESGNPPAVIKPKTNENAPPSQAQGQLGIDRVDANHAKSPVPHSRAELSEVHSVSNVDSESVEFEGESSLHAHSMAARDFLVQMLGNHSQVRDSPRMVAAMNSLRQIVEADSMEPSQKKPKLIGLGVSRQPIYELKLPPTEIVLDILRKSKGKSGTL
jgi:hypothetical protein